MKKYINYLGLIMLLTLIACSERREKNQIIFSVGDSSPPFAYHDQGMLKGFNIDLALLIAQKLQKEAVFNHDQIVALITGETDIMPTIGISEERKKNIDFSEVYYIADTALIFQTNSSVATEPLNRQKLAAVLGSLHERLINLNLPNIKMVTVNTHGALIELLKSGHIDGVITSSTTARIICAKHTKFSYKVIDTAKNQYGVALKNQYGVALKKGSPLREPINEILKKLEENGEMAKLKLKWELEN